MRALQFASFGQPGQLALVTRPDPVPADGQALVAVTAASVNPSDVKNVEGRMEGTVLPRIPGRDFSGTVVAGPRDLIGRPVWGSSGDIGFSVDGSHAEFLLFDAAALAPKPESLTHDQTSAVAVSFLVAWLGLVAYARVQPGETVLVIGLGGVGAAVAQLAALHGARVIAADRRPPPDTGALPRVIDEFILLTDPVEASLAAALAGQQLPLVYDSVGGIMFNAALDCLAQRGRLVEISATGRRRVEFDLVDFYHREAVLIGADTRKLDGASARPILVELGRHFDAGALEGPTIAACYDLDQGIAAYQAVQAGSAGKVILRP